MAALDQEVVNLRAEQKLLDDQLKATAQLKEDLTASVKHDTQQLQNRKANAPAAAAAAAAYTPTKMQSPARAGAMVRSPHQNAPAHPCGDCGGTGVSRQPSDAVAVGPETPPAMQGRVKAVGNKRAVAVADTMKMAKTIFLRHDRDCDGYFSEVTAVTAVTAVTVTAMPVTAVAVTAMTAVTMTAVTVTAVTAVTVTAVTAVAGAANDVVAGHIQQQWEYNSSSSGAVRQ